VENQNSIPPWEEHESEHFSLRYLPDSPAAKDAMEIADRLETVRGIVIRALDLEGLPDERIPVYLSDMPVQEEQVDQSGTGAVTSEPGYQHIRSVYR